MSDGGAPEFVISGYYGFKNAGDEAMLTALLSGLRTLFPESGITVISGNPGFTEARHGVRSLPRLALGRIVWRMRQADLFISGGGSLLQDVTSCRSLLYYLSVIVIGLLCAKQTILLAQGIGPIRHGWLRWLTGMVLRRVPFLTVRDEASMVFLEGLGVKRERIRLTADLVFALPQVGDSDGRILLSRSGLSDGTPVVGVAIRSWQNNVYLGALADALDVLADRGYKILAIPLQYPADLPVVRQLAGAMRHSVAVLDKECSTEELMSVIGGLHTLVAMRLHALIFAALAGCPFVGLEYDPKVSAFVDSIGGVSAGPVRKLRTEGLLGAFALAQDVKLELDVLRSRAAENWSVVEGLVIRG